MRRLICLSRGYREAQLLAIFIHFIDDASQTEPRPIAETPPYVTIVVSLNRALLRAVPMTRPPAMAAVTFDRR